MADTKAFVWPDWMPRPLVNGYGFQPVDRRTKTEMEIGGIYRNEFDTDETRCQCSLFLDADEAAWFESFERDLLGQGSRWFEMPLLVAGEIQYHTVRLHERPKAANVVGCHIEYGLTLDVSKRKLICPAYTEALMHYAPCELRYYSKYFGRLIDETLPGISNIPGGLWP